MRIRDSGSSFFGFGGGGGSRSDSFKQGRRPGQKVKGVLLKWVSNDMAWVEIDGHKLLAQLNSKPQVGALLTFIIKQLTPNIVLKEVFEPASASIPALSMAGDFETARTLFENQLRSVSNTFEIAPRKQHLLNFTKLLSDNKKLLSTFLDTTSCLGVINQTLLSGKPECLFYAPWLIPMGRRHVGLKRHKGDASANLIESLVEFDLKDFGMIRAEFLFKHPTTSYRLKLQHTARAGELKSYLSTRRYSDISGDIQCLGVSQLPQREHGGILAELMFKR